MLRIDTSNVYQFLDTSERRDLQSALDDAHGHLLDRTGKGSEFLGWLDILTSPNDALLEDLSFTASTIREEADVFLCIGIGGSYLGAGAIIDVLSPYFGRRSPEILFAGHHMSGAYIRDLLEHLEGKSVFVNVISKSGTTLEPALAFRFMRSWMEERFEDADRRIIVTTDAEKGVLNTLRKERGYRKYTIPPDVGGRFSVLTPVGLLPAAVAGIDIRALFYGAVAASERMRSLHENPALEYAAARYLLLQRGYPVEALAVFEPRLSAMGGWWQQLFAESEGKEGKGVLPVALQYSTDLHSVGQYVQEGPRILFETFLMVNQDSGIIAVPENGSDLDTLGYLAGHPMSAINMRAYEGTRKAHADGGVPNMTFWIDSLHEAAVGELIYCFEHAVSIGGYLLDINPFNQPGVEAYKKEMYALLKSLH